MITLTEAIEQLRKMAEIDPDMPIFSGRDGELVLIEMSVEGEGDEKYVAMHFVDPMD